jgi:glutaredoxin
MTMALFFVTLICPLLSTTSFSLLPVHHVPLRARVSYAGASEDAVVEVYSTAGCQYCVRAKRALDDVGVVWQNIDVSGSPEARVALAERVGGVTSVPQIVAGGVLVGGFDQLEAALGDGSFLDLVAARGLRRKESPPYQMSDPSPTSPAAGIDILELHDPQGSALNILRDGEISPGGNYTAVAQELQARSLQLFDECVKRYGSGVDYAAIRFSPRMEEFVRVAARLASPGSDTSSAPTSAAAVETSKLSPAFWINLYNALVMHSNVVLGNPTNPAERSAFFSGSTGGRYRVGPFDLSLDDIEHGILRGSPPGDPRSFPEDDPRRSLAIEDPDPRIHFALNCGAKSCPPIKLFTPDGLSKELKLVTEAFVASEVSLDDDTGAVNLSKIFLWYGRDFTEGATGSLSLTDGEHEVKLLRVLASYLPFSSPLRAGITAARSRRVHGMGITQLNYVDYDWAQNDIAE